MNACDYLARVGFTKILAELGGPTLPSWAYDDDMDAIAASREAARLNDCQRVRERITESKVIARSGDLVGAKWLDRVITWPDRVPNLVTWSGNQKLAKIIDERAKLLANSAEVDPLLVCAKFKGASGLDSLTAGVAIDIGFSPAPLGIETSCRPGVELLAIIGLESLPLVSFAQRLCGFIHDGQVWCMKITPRDGGYYYRWEDIRPWSITNA